MGLWPFKKSEFLDPETAAWHIENFRWLVQEFGEKTQFHSRGLVLPTPQTFMTGGKTGTALAEVIFEQVKRHAGLAHWPVQLVPHDSVPDEYEGTNSIRPVHDRKAAGTFSVDPKDGVIITYSVNNLQKPHTLISTFAHELAHYLLATSRSDLPVPADEEEFLTDLTAVFLGFGVFLSNDSFHYEQFQDGSMAGWQWRRLGYLPESDLLFATAVFIRARCLSGEMAARYLKPHLVKNLNRALKQLSGFSLESVGA